MSRLRYIEYKGIKYPIHKDITNIGMNDGGILLFDQTMSQSYIQIKKADTNYYLYPLADKIFLNNKELIARKIYILQDKDIIGLGNIRIGFMMEKSTKPQGNNALLPSNINVKRTIVEKTHYKILLAENSNTKSDVLVKLLTKAGEQDMIAVNKFRRECRIAKQMSLLQHKSVAKVLQVETGMCPRYYIIEGIDGIPLSGYLEKHDTVPTETASKIIIGLISALKCLYERFSLLHRDLTPGNIFIKPDLVPKIYNIETMKGEGASLTVRGEVKGSVLFTAPEIYVDQKAYSIQSDMYSLGLVFLYMIKGRSFLKATLNFDRSKIDIEDANIKNVLYKMLDPQPENRFGNYDDLLCAWEGIMNPQQGIEDECDSKVLESLLYKTHTLNEQNQNLLNANLKDLQCKIQDMQLEHHKAMSSMHLMYKKMEDKIKILEEENIKLKTYLAQTYNP